MLRITDGVATYDDVELGRIEITRHGRRELIATDEFWMAWNNNPEQLKTLGFSCRKTAKGWRAYLSPDNLAEEVEPETIVLTKDISPEFIEVRYDPVNGASTGVGKRPFTDDERRLRYEHLHKRVDVLRRNQQSGLELAIHDEVGKDAPPADVLVQPRKYVVTCHDCTIFESQSVQAAIETYESLAYGYQ